MSRAPNALLSNRSMPGTNVANASCPIVRASTRAGSQIRERLRDGSRVGCSAGRVWDTPASCRKDLVLVGALDDRAGGGLEGQIEGDHRGGGVRVDAEGVLLHGVDHEVVAVHLVALGRGGP